MEGKLWVCSQDKAYVVLFLLTQRRAMLESLRIPQTTKGHSLSLLRDGQGSLQSDCGPRGTRNKFSMFLASI